jgi:hypothetical protein
MRVSPQCLITGCQLFDATAQKGVHGDLFTCGDLYIFNAVLDAAGEAAWIHQMPEPTNPRALRIEVPEFFERRGVIVVHSAFASLTESAHAYLTAAGDLL